MTTTYNVAGHVCHHTGRLAMTVADAYAREDSPDRRFWLYNVEAAGLGLDPWRLLDGIDANVPGFQTTPDSYTLDFAGSARSLNVQGSTIIYMQRTKAEREPPAPMLWRVELMRLVPVGAAEYPTRISMDSIAAAGHEAAASCALALMAAPGDWLAVRADSRRA